MADVEIQVRNVRSELDLEELIHEHDGGIEIGLDFLGPTDRHSMFMDAILLVGQIATIAFAVQTILKILDLPKKKSDEPISVIIKNAGSGAEIEIKDKNRAKLIEDIRMLLGT
jgi:uncharacterized membrane protein